MATQADIDSLKQTYSLELSLIGLKMDATVFLVLSGSKIQVLLSRLAFTSEDPVEVEKFIAAAAGR